MLMLHCKQGKLRVGHLKLIRFLLSPAFVVLPQQIAAKQITLSDLYKMCRILLQKLNGLIFHWK